MRNATPASAARRAAARRRRRGQPGRDGGLQHLAAGPRVTADDGERPRSESPAQHAAARRPDACQLRRQLGVGQPRTPSVPNSRPIDTPLGARCGQDCAAAGAAARRPSAESTGGQVRRWHNPRHRLVPNKCRGGRRSHGDQRFEYCGALRAFFRPYFLRSLARASRVRKPAFFSAGRSSSSSSISARAMPGAARRPGR